MTNKVVTKTEVLDKITELQEYSVSTYNTYITDVLEKQTSTSSTIETKVDVSTFFETLKNTVNTFFDPQDLSNAVQSVLGTMKSDLIRRSFKFEKTVDFGFPTDYPNGYLDLVSFAYDFSDILNVSNETFYSGFYWSSTDGSEPSETSETTDGTDDTDSTDTSKTQIQTQISGNSYIDTWVTKIASEKSRECSDLETVASWCQNALGNFFVTCQTENLGNIKEKMEDTDAWVEIYKNRGLYDLIKGRELSNHVPSEVQKVIDASNAQNTSES